MGEKINYVIINRLKFSHLHSEIILIWVHLQDDTILQGQSFKFRLIEDLSLMLLRFSLIISYFETSYLFFEYNGCSCHLVSFL